MAKVKYKSFGSSLSLVVKSVSAKGKILSNSETHVDNLGHVVYSKALAREIQTVQSPITIGIFSSWGCGKSFLLKQIEGLLDLEQKQNNMKTQRNKLILNKSLCKIVMMTLLFLTLITFLVFAILCGTILQKKTLSIVFTVLLLSLLLALYFIMQCLGKNWFASSSLKYTWTLVYAYFTKLPIGEAETLPVYGRSFQTKTVIKQASDKTIKQKIAEESSRLVSDNCSESSAKKRKYIFVNYNAWEFSGSDVLWAGIVMNLADGIERVLGKMTARLFRAVDLETTSPEALKEETRLLVKLPLGEFTDEENVFKLVSKYGVIKVCERFGDLSEEVKKKIRPCLEDEENRWWIVTYSNQIEAENAKKTLKNFNVNARLYENKPDEGMASQQPRFWRHLRKQPKCTCGIPNMYWAIIFVVSAILIPVVCSVLNFAVPQFNGGLSFAIAIASLIPIAMAPIVLALKLLWAMCSSQRNRIAKALQGTAGNVAKELGFMNKIQCEVSTITNLIHAVEFVHNVEYKVIITIDDLDRVPLPKVKAVLESVNVLLSQRNSPFICLIAIDPTIAVKAFEGNTSGYEYLKKVINLPFCLPKNNIEDTKRYISGLIDEADETKEETYFETFDETAYQLPSANPVAITSTSTVIARSSAPEEWFNVHIAAAMSQPINFESFLFACRKYMFESDVLLEHLEPNPTNIKRIFNIISVTVSVMRQYQEQMREQTLLQRIAGSRLRTVQETQPDGMGLRPEHKALAEDIVLWVVLSEQWPFRVSYVLAAIDDANLRYASGRIKSGIDDSENLLDIYESVTKEIKSFGLYKELCILDKDPELLYSYLRALKKKKRLNKGRVMELLKDTIGLDQSLSQVISYQRDFTLKSSTEPNKSN